MENTVQIIQYSDSILNKASLKVGKKITDYHNPSGILKAEVQFTHSDQILNQSNP